MLRQLEKCGALKELHDASAGYAAMKNCSTAVQSQLLLTFSLALISKMDFLITPRQRLTILSPLPRLAWRVARLKTLAEIQNQSMISISQSKNPGVCRSHQNTWHAF
jgi:hypothetical protein